MGTQRGRGPFPLFLLKERGPIIGCELKICKNKSYVRKFLPQVPLPISGCVNENSYNAQEYIEVDISDSKYGKTHWAGQSGDLGSNAGTIYT